MTHATRDTSTGLKWEEKAIIETQGIDVTKHDLYKYLAKAGIDWKKLISKKLLPDQAFIYNSCLFVFEKKFQQTNGSADEKPQTCAFKIRQFNKIAKALGLEKATYTYVFNSWFKKPEYADMLSFIKETDGCDYIFYEGE